MKNQVKSAKSLKHQSGGEGADCSQKARELTRRKTPLKCQSSRQTGRLFVKDPSISELLSSRNSAVRQNKAETAIFKRPSAEGKILNVEKARLDKILSNNEVRAIVTACGQESARLDISKPVTIVDYHRYRCGRRSYPHIVVNLFLPVYETAH